MRTKRKGPRSADEVAADIHAAPGKNRRGAIGAPPVPGDERRPSILDDAAAMTASKRWAFTAEQLADIAEVRAAVTAGKIPHVGSERLARILKTRYALPWSVASIRGRIRETP